MRQTVEVRTTRPQMTAGRAAILKVMDTYRVLGYGLSKVEAQKLAYFLQAAGQDLRLQFVQHQYGPYSDGLRHALQRMEGHFIRGLGDGVVAAEIEPLEDALAEADAFIRTAGDTELSKHVGQVGGLIEGFQSSYGMELLATVHWVATHPPAAQSLDEAIQRVHQWNGRKRRLMSREHITVAWERLTSTGWLHHAA